MNFNNISTIQAITDFLFLFDKPQKVDLMFVFGHSYLSAMDEVKKLYDKKYANHIIIAGSSKDKRKKNEAERFFKRGVELGIPKKVFLLEKKSSNTKENLIFSKKIIKQSIGFDNIKSIMFVCKAFHTRRVLMTAKRFFPPNIRFYFFPIIDERNIRKDNWWIDKISRTRVLEEVKRIGEYALKDDLSLKN